MKRIVIPLSLIVAIFVAAQILSVTNDVTEKTKNGDINGATQTIANEAVEEAKDKATELLWTVLVYNPLVWLLGIIGSAIGIRFVIK